MIEFVKVDPKEVLSDLGMQDLAKLISISAVEKGLARGGWIAGGAVRALLCGTTLSDYFSYAEFQQSGDIDIFFPSSVAANEAIASLDKKYTSRSYGGNATQLNDSLAYDGIRSTVTVQYVDNQDFCNPDMLLSLQRFDFVNCMVAFDGRSIIMPKGWRDLEETKLLRIHNAHSPYLASRIKKYVKYRGYSGISPDSREVFADWLVRSRSVSNFSSFGKPTASALEAVKQIGHLMTGEELLLFIGKWSVVEKHNNYGHMFDTHFDWALDHIQKSSNKGCSNPSI